MNPEIKTMTDAVIQMVEASVQCTSVTGGCCGPWCTDARD